ncbi:MAG: hypothetical protein ACRD2S_08995 [Terriglobales bacterium]
MAEMLRPMSTGELMDRTFVLYRRNFKLFVGIASLGPASYLVFQLLTIGSASLRAGRINPFSAVSLGVGFLAGFLIMVVGAAIAHGATVKAVAAVHLGLPIRIVEAYRALKGKIWRIIGVVMCVWLFLGLAIIVAGLTLGIAMVILRTLFFTAAPSGTGQIMGFVFGLLIGLFVIIAATLVWVRYALAIACCVVEEIGVVKSIRRSTFLSKGSRFRIFLIYLVFFILAALLGAALGALAGAAGTLIPNVVVRLILVYLSTFIAGLLTGPLATIGIALVYYDERVRKEAFDIQFMMATLDAPVQLAPVTVPVQTQ